MARLERKVAVVTGGSKGIGTAIARALAEAGAAVAVNYARDRDGADRTVRAIEEAGGRAIAVQADVSSRTDIDRLFAETFAAWGRLDILVNNAAVYEFGPVDSISETEFHRHFDTNVLSVFLTTQAALARFGADGGSIINIVSAAVEAFAPNTSLYAATKTAVVTLTRIAAKELGSRNIRVNAIAPGPTRTEGLAASDFGPEQEAYIVASSPLGRMGEARDIGPSAVFLASDEAAWITGNLIFASGGLR